MKHSKFISLVLAVSVLGGACAVPKATSTSDTSAKKKSPAISLDDGEGAEHCLVSEKETCFLEIDNKGKSRFYATGESYEKLLLDPILAEINIQLKPIDGADYQQLKIESKAKVVYEGAESNEVSVYADKVDDSSNFIFLIFRIVGFLWKGKGYVDTAKTTTGILSKIPGIDKLMGKASGFKDKLKDKLKDKIKDIFTGGDADPVKDPVKEGEEVVKKDDTANSLSAKITWHYGNSVVTRDVPIPEEFLEPLPEQAVETADVPVNAADKAIPLAQ